MTTPTLDAGEPVATAPQADRSLATVVRNVFTAENSALVTVLAILLSLVVGAVLIVLSNTSTMDMGGYFFQDPSDFLSSAWQDISSAYSALFEGAIFNPATLAGTPQQFFGPITNTLEDATPLIFGGLAISVAFRAGMFNIGGQGQTIVGAIFSSYAAFAWTDVPGVLHLVVSVLAGIVGGLLFGGLVGWLKARRGAHEVIVTIMLNYVAFFFLGSWLLNTSVFHDPKNAGQAISKPASASAVLPHLFGDGLNTDVGLLLALAATFGTAWFFNRSKLGFEVRAVGLTPSAARTAGIDVGRIQIASMLISGALMGMIGVTQTLGLANPNNNSLSPNIDAGLGFTAITVALLGRTKPWGVVWASLLFGALQAGGALMQTEAQVSIEIVTVMQALIVIFVAAPRLVKEIFRLRAARVVPAAAVAQAAAAQPQTADGQQSTDEQQTAEAGQDDEAAPGGDGPGAAEEPQDPADPDHIRTTESGGQA
ncbi:ABC transporter permease [Streptacidiphilus sp. PB12-B1b]|uniref:ABC transporter permease n=1 Tax=Streptacidiphilus sp. PB12-B1b TaxID=2705012 RepID=UPI0015FB5C05|nr:ABC transporter permease [Streptacidiphilus sp. PB12-B1b]QMU77721.1 ABC transporter permease [Streptacidiphilus sp. PB12-B1b]